MKQCNEIEKEVEATFLEKEYAGVYESVLHLKIQLEYLRSAEGAKVLTDAFGEIDYKNKVDKQLTSLNAREAELKYMRRQFK